MYQIKIQQQAAEYRTGPYIETLLDSYLLQGNQRSRLLSKSLILEVHTLPGGKYTFELYNIIVLECLTHIRIRK